MRDRVFILFITQGKQIRNIDWETIEPIKIIRVNLRISELIE